MSKKFIIGICLILSFILLVFDQNVFRNIKSKNKISNLLNDSNQVNDENKFSPVNSGRDLSDVVMKICESIEKTNVEDLKNFVTEVPDVYIQKSRESMRKYLKMDEKTFRKANEKKTNTYTVAPYPVSSNKEELVHNAIPAIDVIQGQKRKFIKTYNLKQNENEAKVIVTFADDESKSVNYEILLIRIDEDWKMFSFTYPSQWSNTYAEKNQE